jgi:GntR family transcriptional regulator, vanillate catabolism transcriptional regulator
VLISDPSILQQPSMAQMLMREHIASVKASLIRSLTQPSDDDSGDVVAAG